jgi:hypothetical protein
LLTLLVEEVVNASVFCQPRNWAVWPRKFRVAMNSKPKVDDSIVFQAFKNHVIGAQVRYNNIPVCDCLVILSQLHLFKLLVS